jgi:acetyltransferase-like isoleucine patch superfamily enzyme
MTAGVDVVVWHFARVLADVVIGDHCSIGGGAEIGRGTLIGDHSRISANVFLPSNTVIGDHVFIGPGVVCTDDRYPRTLEPGETYEALPPCIGDYASIGAGAVLLPGVQIGKRARIAAGAIVTRDVPDEGMVRGEPARMAERSEASKNW